MNVCRLQSRVLRQDPVCVKYGDPPQDARRRLICLDIGGSRKISPKVVFNRVWNSLQESIRKMPATATLPASWQAVPALQTTTCQNSHAKLQVERSGHRTKSQNASAFSLRSSFLSRPVGLNCSRSLVSTLRTEFSVVQALDPKLTDKMWPDIFRVLVVKVSSVTVDDLKAMQARKDKFTVVDVRPPEEFAEFNIPGSINVPLYKQIVGWTPLKITRRVAFAFFGIFNGTELNEQFMAEFSAAMPNKDETLLLCCGTGGTLRRTETSPNGRTSRSLLAAELALNNGYKKLMHLDGGISAYGKAEDAAAEAANES
eukprot:jgi/Mesvir1/23901/Mv10684-RA.1